MSLLIGLVNQKQFATSLVEVSRSPEIIIILYCHRGSLHQTQLDLAVLLCWIAYYLYLAIQYLLCVK